MKKARIAAAVTSVFALVTWTGCSSPDQPAEQPAAEQAAELTVLSGIQPGTSTGKVQADIIAQFEQKTGKKIKLVPAGEDLVDIFETSVAGGKEADVVAVNLAEKSTDWVDSGIVEPASTYLDDWALADKIKPEALDAWKNKDGVVQGFPYNGFVWPVWYNTKLLQKAGVSDVPKTTDELVAAAGKLKAANIPPVIVGGIDWSGQKLFLQITEMYLTPDEATEVFTNGGYCKNPKAMQGITLFTQLRDAGIFVKDVQGYTADQMNAAFYAEKAAIMPAGSWAFESSPPALADNVTLGGFPLPSGSVYGKPTAYQGYTGPGFWVSKNGAADDKVGLAKDYISLWYEPDNAAKFAEASNGPVAVAAATELTTKNKITAQAVNDLSGRVDFALMPDTAVPGSVADPMIRQTGVAYAPGTTPEQICDSLDKVYDQ